MIEILAILCILCALGLLIALSVIDLKHWILPDELNAALGITGIIFHLVTAYRFAGIEDMAAGAAVGAGLLYVIRFFANRYYGRDALGLGDVKLMGAAGLWLGLEGTLEAITLGAGAGLVHGLCYAGWLAYKTKARVSVGHLSIPAGPGFATGIVIAGYFMFHDYIWSILHDFAA